LKKELLNQNKKSVLIGGIALFLLLSNFSLPQSQSSLNISVKDFSNLSRIIVESSLPLSFEVEKRPSDVRIIIRTNTSFQIQKEPFESSVIRSFGWRRGRDYYILTFNIIPRRFSSDYFTLDNPPQLIIDVSPLSEKKEELLPEPTIVPPLPRTERPSSPSREIKTVIIDPGHGGLWPGATGKGGTLEKDITLAISLKLAAVIRRNLALRVVLTRDKDVDVSLEDRAAMANNNKADIFLSIHANSSYQKNARGPETYFLSLEATDEEARKLAYLENNPTQPEEGIAGDNQDEIQMILWDMAQTAYLKQSSELAESIQNELNLLLRTRNRGIRQAPFTVLAGVACSAVLVEVAFLSNSREERRLLNEDFQNEVAQAIYDGLVSYLQRNS
jgi:N-acetylmuramoyl-L-alanine amidase